MMVRTRCGLLLAGVLAAGTAAAGASASASPAALAPGVHWLPGRFVAGAQPDGNSVIFDGKSADGSRALVVFDSGRHAAHTQAIIDYAHARNAPIAAIVNSHWHLDHVGGNIRLRAAFPHARVYASTAIEDAMHGFLARYRTQLEDAIAKAGEDSAKQAPWRAEIALIDAGSTLFPDEPIAKTQRRDIAGRALQLGYERRAVTAGDVWMFDAKTGVLASGDLVTLPAPLFDTACPQQWSAALDDLDAVRFKTLVPGHGAPMTRADFETYRSAFAHLLQCASGNAEKAACIDGWMHDAAPLIAAGDDKLARSLLDYYLDGNLRNADTQRSLCAA